MWLSSGLHLNAQDRYDADRRNSSGARCRKAESRTCPSTGSSFAVSPAVSVKPAGERRNGEQRPPILRCLGYTRAWRRSPQTEDVFLSADPATPSTTTVSAGASSQPSTSSYSEPLSIGSMQSSTPEGRAFADSSPLFSSSQLTGCYYTRLCRRRRSLLNDPLETGLNLSM
jgi:hypothetical protein